MKRSGTDFDGIWKETVVKFPEATLTRFFPAVAREIDWAQGVEFLDKELRSLVGKFPRPRQFVDVLMKVHWRKGGSDLLLIHMEIQRQADAEFPFRMLMYQVTLRKVLGRDVLSLAVLADTDPEWRPSEYVCSMAGMEHRFVFPVCKLIDFTDEALEADLNPVNFVILAERIARRHGLGSPGRRKGKLGLMLRLARLAGRQGYSFRACAELTRLVDWSITLSETEEAIFDKELDQIQEETPMPYVTSYERRALKKGLEQGLEQGREEGREEGLARGTSKGWVQALTALVTVRFPDWKPSWNQHLESVTDASKLQHWIGLAGTLDSGEAFLRAIGKKP